MKDIGYYPKGPINQHKALATGAKLPKANTSNKETVPSPWGGGGATEGGTNIKSGTSTGSGGGKGVPKSTFTPA